MPKSHSLQHLYIGSRDEGRLEAVGGNSGIRDKGSNGTPVISRTSNRAIGALTPLVPSKELHRWPRLNTRKLTRVARLHQGAHPGRLGCHVYGGTTGTATWRCCPQRGKARASRAHDSRRTPSKFRIWQVSSLRAKEPSHLMPPLTALVAKESLVAIGPGECGERPSGGTPRLALTLMTRLGPMAPMSASVSVVWPRLGCLALIGALDPLGPLEPLGPSFIGSLTTS